MTLWRGWSLRLLQTAVDAGLQLCLLAFLAARLGPASFGAYAAVVVVVTLAVQVGEAGLSTLMWRVVAMAGGESHRAGGSILRTATLGGLGSGFLLAAMCGPVRL